MSQLFLSYPLCLSLLSLCGTKIIAAAHVSIRLDYGNSLLYNVARNDVAKHL